MALENVEGSSWGLDRVLITDELVRRPARPPDLRAENRALHGLARRIAEKSEAMLDTLAAMAVDLCRAGTAGVSLLEPGDDGGLFRWVALSGGYEAYRGSTIPGGFSPCGTCLERRSPQLYSYPARHFTHLGGVEPPIVEGLVIPLIAADGGPLGTFWITSHDEGRRFDGEDLRVMTALAEHAAVALRPAASASENAGLSGKTGEEMRTQRAEEALREADKRKDEFLAMLAHELRNPLAPIRTGLQILRYTEGGNPAIEPLRAMMERQVMHLTRLVDDLMDVSRITRDKIELRKEVVDLTTLLAHVVETNRPAIEERQQQLIVEWPQEPLRLEGDSTRLEQILDNLLNNACKYTDPEGRIRITAGREGVDVVVRVRDTGIGIAPENLPHVFDPFVQAERRLDRSQGGLGLGLSLVRSLAELHRGAVTAQSEGLGRGSEFILRLPALTTSEVEGDPTDRGADLDPIRTLPRRRILVVDDNLDSAHTMALLLRRSWGQEVEVADNGATAIEAAITFRPDVILLDIGLPGMSGYEVAKRLRERPEFASTFVVAMTGWGQQEDRLLSREAGFDHHLVKPVDTDVLRALLFNAETVG